MRCALVDTAYVDEGGPMALVHIRRRGGAPPARRSPSAGDAPPLSVHRGVRLIRRDGAARDPGVGRCERRRRDDAFTAPPHRGLWRSRPRPPPARSSSSATPSSPSSCVAPCRRSTPARPTSASAWPPPHASPTATSRAGTRSGTRPRCTSRASPTRPGQTAISSPHGTPTTASPPTTVRPSSSFTATHRIRASSPPGARAATPS